MNKLTKILLLVLHFGLIGGASAASISLSPTPQNAVVNKTVSFVVKINFSDVATDGGSFNISYDSTLLGDANFSYSSFSSPIYATWTLLPSSYSTGQISGVGFDASSFQADDITLGTLSFTAVGAGIATVGMSEAATDYRFIESNDPWSAINVSYTGGTANISAVPVPAAVWLMASGLLGMVGLSRRA